MMIDVKSVLLESDTHEHLRRLDGILQDDCVDAASAEVSYEEDALARVHSLSCGLLLPHGQNARVPEEVYDDIEMFKSYSSASSSTVQTSVFASIDRTQLKGARHYLQEILRHPLCTATELVNRQNALAKLDQVYSQNKDHIDTLMQRAAKHERHALWMYRHVDEELQSLHDIAFFRTFLMDRLNGCGTALTVLNFYKIIASPLIGIMSPIIYFMLPFLIMRLRFGIRVPFRTYLWILWRSISGGSPLVTGGGRTNGGGSSWLKSASLLFSMVFYFQSLFTSFEVSSTLQKICNIIVSRVKAMEIFFATCQELLQILWMPSIVKPWFSDQSYVLGGGGGPVYYQAPNHDEGVTHHHKFHVFSNFGEQLKTFRNFDRNSHGIVMNRIHAMSALLSILAVKRDAESGFCSARFDSMDPSRPGFSASHMWHPCLERSQVVHNDMFVGRVGRAPPGILLTGPNAGGKSTLLKSSLICVLLAQTLTIAPASKCCLTPFSLINSHMNVPDCKGMASLFEAEMRRAKQYIDNVKALKNSKKSAFIVMDEIFSSTNPVEGMAGAYSVAKQLVTNDHCICIVSTHFTYLAKLSSKDASKNMRLYANWQMPVRISSTSSGDIEYPYKLQRGVCRQYIALDILQRNGFDKDIINDAMQVKEDLLLHAGGKKKKTTSKTTDGDDCCSNKVN